MDYVSAYNFCKETVANSYLIPSLTDNQIVELISREDWLMFKLDSELDKNEAKIVARPNIYLRIKGTKFIMGLTLNQIKAVKWFIEISEDYNQQTKTELITLVKQLPNEYLTTLERKIKDSHPMQVPKYSDGGVKFQSNLIEETKIVALCTQALQITDEGKIKTDLIKQQQNKYYSEFPAINLAKVEDELTEENIKNAATLLFPILAKCLSIEQRVKIPEEITNIINKIKQQKQWWFFIKSDNSILFNKFEQKPSTEEFNMAIKIIRKSPEFHQLVKEWGC